MVFLLLLAVFWLLYLAWCAILAFHSPMAPSPATGHVMPLGGGRNNPMYVRPWEAWVGYGLVLLANLVPPSYVAWKSRRRRKG